MNDIEHDIADWIVGNRKIVESIRIRIFLYFNFLKYVFLLI